MLLKKLIKKHPQNIKNIKIKGISLDSRKVKKGDIFFCYQRERKMEICLLILQLKSGC